MAVSRILSWMIIYLSDIPEELCRTGCPPSVLSCTAWGFSCRANCSARGELLPRLFTLACLREQQLLFQRTGGVFSVTLSVNARFREPCPRILRGMLPYGVRTFLQRTLRLTSDHLPSAGILAQIGLTAMTHRSQPGQGESRPPRAGGATATNFCCQSSRSSSSHTSPGQSFEYRSSDTFVRVCRRAR